MPKIPKFLQQLSDEHTPKVEQPSFSDGDDDNNELLGQDAPQVVVLKKRHLTKEQASEVLGGTQSKIQQRDGQKIPAGQSNIGSEGIEDGPSVDANGRLLFKKGIKPSTNAKKEQAIDRLDAKHRDATNTTDEPALKKTKRTNKGKSKVTLSFDIQD